jgi:hypothetical protein
MQSEIKQQLEEADKLVEDFLNKIKSLEERSLGHVQIHIWIPVESNYFPSPSFFDDDGNENRMYKLKEIQLRPCEYRW